MNKPPVKHAGCKLGGVIELITIDGVSRMACRQCVDAAVITDPMQLAPRGGYDGEKDRRVTARVRGADAYESYSASVTR